MKAWDYQVAGLSVRSVVQVADWHSVPMRRWETTDVVVRRSLQALWSESEGNALRVKDGKLLFRIADIAQFRVAADAIDFHALKGGGKHALALYLQGSAWGALGYLRGWIPLHASVVEHRGGAVALCAPSGQGKSTLCAWLTAQGMTMLGDDLCRVDAVPPRPLLVWPASATIKLWRDALGALGVDHEGLERDLFRDAKFRLTLNGSNRRGQAPLPLRAIYIIGWGEGDIVRLKGRAAVDALAESATYRAEFVQALGLGADYYRRMIDIASNAMVFSWRRPRNLTQLAETGHRLLDHMGGLNTCI